MARPRNMIPQYISLDMLKLDMVQIRISSDAEFGKWMRKAIRDFRSGCCAPDVDPFVKEQYDVAYSRMVKRQELDSAAYRSNKEHTHTSRKGRNTATAVAESGNTSENCNTNGTPSVSIPESSTTAVATLDLTKQKSAYGESKTVLLTIEEGEKLRQLYGENLELAIDILDSHLINTKRKYKSHYHCLKKSGWVWNAVQEKLKATAQLKKAESAPKSFAAQERERAARGAEYLLSLQEAM